MGGQAGKAGKGVRLAKITHTRTHKCTCKSLCHLQRSPPCQSSKAHRQFFSFSSFFRRTLPPSVLFYHVSLPLVPCKNNPVCLRVPVLNVYKIIHLYLHACLSLSVCECVCECVCVCVSPQCAGTSHGYHELMSSI